MKKAQQHNTTSTLFAAKPLSATTLIVIAIVLSAIIPPSALAITSSSPSLSATLLSYDPVPATPGSIVDVFVQVQNTGTTSKKVIVQFVDNGPFTLESETDRVKSTDSIPAGQGFLLKYRVRVSKDALPGTNYIKINYGPEDNSDTQTSLLTIDVQSTTASLDITKVQLTPQTFAPGSNGDVMITIENNAGLKIASGTLKLDLSQIDMAPIGGTNQQRFTDMQANSEQQFTFTLAPSPSTPPGVYKVPVVITFKDQKGTQYNVTEYIGIPVGVEPELLVYFDKTTVLSNTKTGTATIKFVNKGLSQIKFLSMQVLESPDVKVISESTQAYVGNINEDDYQTTDVTLKLEKDNVVVPIKVTYRDALNRPYETTINLSLHTQDANNGKSTNWSTIILVVVLLGIVSYFVIKRWRGSKGNKR